MADRSGRSRSCRSAGHRADRAAADWLVIAPVAVPILTGALLLMLRHQLRLHARDRLAGSAAILAVCAALLLRARRRRAVRWS